MLNRSSPGRFFSGMRHAARGLARRPLFALTAIVSLGLGLGANLSVFTVVNALLLRPLPYDRPDELVAIWPAQTFGMREIEALRSRARSYALVGLVSPGWLMGLRGVAVPSQLSAGRVSGNLFSMLGVQPMMGRTFGMEGEVPGNDRVVVLSWGTWRDNFGGDPGIIGRSIELDRQPYEVIGVMPRDFRPMGITSDLWTPLTSDEASMWWSGATALAFARLAPGATPASATVELTGLAAQFQREFQQPPSWTQNVSVVDLQQNMVGGTRLTLIVLFSAVAFLLLIASANVANLLLVRNAERRHELAVRVSLGATAGDLARFLAAESLVLGVAGGVVGMALAAAGVGLLRRILPSSLPRVEEISLDGSVVAVAAGLSVAAAVLFGMAPALQARGAALAARMREGRTTTSRGDRTRGAMVAIEVALAVILTVGATLMGRTLVALNQVDPGFRTDHLLTMRIQTSAESNEALNSYWTTLLDRVESLPGVSGAATVLHLPTSGRKWMGAVEVEGRPLDSGESPKRTAWQAVSPGYFRTAGIPVLRGRPLSSDDNASVPRVMAVNTAFADLVFGAEDPIGKRVKAGNGTQGDWATVIAVVGNVRHDSLGGAPGPEIYVPFAQRTVFATSLVVRTAGAPLALAQRVRDVIWEVDRNTPISEVRTMDDLYAASLARQRMVLVLMGLFAGLGLVLSAVGIYGVVAYGVRQRTKEVGIRVALGADANAIHRMVIGQGLRYAGFGLLAGIPLAFALSRLMRAMVFGVTTSDPLSFTVVPVVLLLVAAAASWIPARRAAAADPVTVLRDG